jgi:hypothetical protein
MHRISPLFTIITPLAFLILLLLSFGLMIPWLGFYWDDWPVILASRLQGVGAFWDFYRYERPLSAWTYITTIPILGTRPIVWHIFTLLLRWVTVVGMWWSLHGVWPQRKREVTWMALLFAIYPIFSQQSVSVAFSQHWICYALYFLSLGTMIYSIRKPRLFWHFNLIGVLATLVNMLTLEYFWGLEILRPVFIWLVYGEYELAGRRRLWATLKLWLPYLIVLVVIITLRVMYMEVLRVANEPSLLLAFGENPFATITQFLQISIQDMINNLMGAWYQVINPTDLVLTDRPVLFSLLISFLTAVMTFFFLLRLSASDSENSSSLLDQRWVKQPIVVGVLGVILGPIPVWIIERQSLFGLYSGRFALAAMFGLSILVVGLLEWFTPRMIPKVLLLAVLIGLSTGFHIRTSVTFYRSTLKQNQFYWQLYWRAPNIKPGTAILSADELFPYVGRKPTAITLNLLYPQTYGSRQVNYWFLELDHDVGSKMIPKLTQGESFTPSFRTFKFDGSSLDSLVVFYKPGAGRCLWVLSPDDSDNPELPDLTNLALPVSNLNRIEDSPTSSNYPPVEFFGKEPQHDWCYYFQKADLAHQMKEWGKVVQSGNEAQDLGYSPGNANEWLPFIEGYARSRQWQEALEFTHAAYLMDEDIAPRLCLRWDHILQSTKPPSDVEVNEDVIQLQSQLNCQKIDNSG